MAVTLKDIAKKAGVTPTVVSHVLNDRLGHIRVSKAKSALIREVAVELGYVPNLKARAMITRKSYTIGLICSYPYKPDNQELQSVVDSYMVSALRGVEQACREVDYHCLVSYCDLSNLENFVHPRAMQDGSVDGVVLIGYTSSDVVRKLTSMGIPCVQIGSNIESYSNDIDCVYADLDDGFAQAVRYLASLGHRRIQLYLPDGPGPKLHAENFRKLSGQIEGVSAEVVLGSNLESHIEYGYKHAEGMLNRKDRPSAFIMGIVHAIGFSKCFSEAGLACPRDYSLMYFTSNFANRYICDESVSRPVSLIWWNGVDVGYIAARKLLSKLGVITLSSEEQRCITVPCKLIYGASCSEIAKIDSTDWKLE